LLDLRRGLQRRIDVQCILRIEKKKKENTLHSNSNFAKKRKKKQFISYF
jgi:hypothetical protein